MKPENSSPILQPESLPRQLEQPLSFRQASLNKVLRSVQAGNCCRVLGPRYRFKSKLMRQAVAILQENGTHYTAYQSLAEVELNSESSFFASLYARMQKGLFPTQPLPGQIYPSSASEFQQALINLIGKSDRNLAVFIDDLEIAPPNLVALLLGALRAVFTTVIDRPGARFQAVVCGSLSLSQIALANASRFESISDLVLVDDLDETERLVLARALCQEAGLTPTVAGLRVLLAQTGGDLSLIKRISEICFDQMKRSKRKKMTRAGVTWAIELFLNSLQPDWIVVETLRQIESNPSLLSCALRLLKRRKVPAAHLPIAISETPTVLDLCGVFSQVDGNYYQIKSKLWSRVLRKHLTPSRVGGLYAMTGYWDQAIKYLGQAIQAGQREVKPELFTATINAMHASDNSLSAFGYLAQGLQAAYPGSDLLFYHRTNTALELVYPRKRHGRFPHIIPLSNLDFPEIEALDGPDYSLVSGASDSQLLLPLRTGLGTHAIGLVSLGHFKSQPSPYHQREEILQLTALLHQAARAIEMKDQILDLLNTTQERADKLKALNSILTRILHHRDRSEDTLLRLILTGVTSSWGLEFNRAILFMPDDNRQRLVGRLAVGHLTRQEAEADWQAFPHQNLEDLADYLLTHEVEEMPLHQQIKHLKFSLESAQNNLLVKAFKICEPMFNSNQQVSAVLPEALFRMIGQPPEFALVPLRAADQTLGILYVDDKFTEQIIGPERFELLQSFINQAALALESIRRYQQVIADLERRQERLETMARITSIITRASGELESDVLREVLSEVKRAIPQAHNVGIVRFDAAKQNLLLSSANLEFYRVDQPPTHGSYRVDTEQHQGIAGRVIETGQAVIIPDVKADKDYISAIDSTRSALAAPIKINRETWAALILESNNLDAFLAEDKRLLETLANHVAIAIQSVQQFQLTRERELRERTAMMATGLIHDIYSAVANIPDLVDELENKIQSGGDITKPLAGLRKDAFDTDRVSSKLKNFVITGQFEPNSVDLESLIQKAMSISKRYEPDYVKTFYTMNGLTLQIWADALWIELLLKNLLVNAYDAIPLEQNGIVSIEVEEGQEHVLIRVCDNGKGIAAELIPDIFEFGFTTKGGNRMQGIGLYHCRQIVAAHNGKLDVTSKPGVKTIFTVSLPLHPPPS